MEKENNEIAKETYSSCVATNGVVIGLGSTLYEGDGCIIIGDNIHGIDRSQENVFYVEYYNEESNSKKVRMVIGETLFGEKCNLKELIEKYLNK